MSWSIHLENDVVINQSPQRTGSDKNIEGLESRLDKRPKRPGLIYNYNNTKLDSKLDKDLI